MKSSLIDDDDQSNDEVSSDSEEKKSESSKRNDKAITSNINDADAEGNKGEDTRKVKSPKINE